MIAILKRVPFLSGVVKFVTGNVRLAIEYALIGLIVVSTATSVTLWYRTKTLEDKNDTLHSRVAINEIVNKTQDATIADLKELRVQDAATMVGLIADYAKLSKSDGRARKKLADLEKENANIRAYLEQPLPPELACMFNGTCTTTASKDSR